MQVADIVEKEAQDTALEKNRPVPLRVRVAEVLAFVGLVAALIGAIGPADRLRTTYTWPPPEISSEAPRSLWYTPLLLSARIPESLSVTLPCDAGEPLGPAGDVYTVLATARNPRRVEGLALVRNSDQIVLTVGENVLRRVAVLNRAGCSYEFRIAQGRWSLDGGAGMSQAGSLGYMPVVNGLFSEVDFRPVTQLTAELTTRVHTTTTTTLQALAWIVAALCIAGALLAVALGSGARDVLSAISPRRLISSLRWADGVIVVTILVWWILAPTQWDDGWVAARQTAFEETGGFSNYYDSLGVNLPIGYWLEWLQHWLTQSSSALLTWRVGAVLCLLVAWGICRFAFTRVATSAGVFGRLPLWALASAFLAAAMAWGMTLRPEPIIAVLVTGVIACVVTFVERPSAAPLAIAAVLVPLAITGHQVGVVSVAPLLAVVPLLFRWVRANVPAATALATASFAALMLLAFVGADLGQRSADARELQTYGIERAWYNEFERYSLLSFVQGGTPLRRGVVALMLLTIVGYVTRRRRERRSLMDLPAMTLALSLLVLFVVPSKWPWHFGALVGMAALAAAAETIRLREDARSSEHLSRVRPFVAIGALVVAIAWAWGPRQIWGILDLRVLDWRPDFEQTISLSVLAALAPLALLALLAGVQRIRHRRPSRAAWRVVGMSVPLLVAPMIAFTVAVLVADTAKSDSWSLARQNLDTLSGDLGCGLADDVVTPLPNSMRPLSGITASPPRTPRWAPPAPVAGLPRFALGPTGGGTAATPWFRVSGPGSIGVFVAGTLSADDTISVESGRLGDGGVESVRRETLAVDSGILSIGVSPWLLVPVSAVVESQDAIRVTLESDIAPGAAVAVAGPVRYATTTFTELLAGTDRRTLVSPGLLPFFPCVTQPELADGVVELPQYIVSATSQWQRCPCPVGYTTSPFFGLHDVYRSTKLAWTDPHDTSDEVAIHRVEPEIPGARLLPARMEVVSGDR